MNVKLITLLLLSCVLSLKAQNLNQCAFDEIRSFIQSSDSNFYYSQQNQDNQNWWDYWRNTHPQQFGYKPFNGVETRGACTKARIIIPVAVHVIHNGGAENITKSQAQNAIDAINEHFANVLGASDPLAVNTGIQFVLARFDDAQNALTVHRKPTQSGQLMGLKMASPDTFVNIWVVRQILDTTGNDVGVNGYATYPGMMFYGGKQGVVVRYNWFGKASFGTPLHSRARGDVLSHEVGHYLGLFHPFEGSCVGLNDANAYSAGDLCRDVPSVKQADTNYFGPINTCSESYSLPPYGVDPPDQKQVFMDYTSPEYKTSFTNDQTKLMYARIEQYHPTLGSPLYMPIGFPNTCISSARIDGITGACKGDSIKLSTYDLSSTGGTASYSWKLYKDTTIIATFTNGPNFSYAPDTGIFSVYLQVVRNGKYTYDTLKNQVEVMDCSKRLPSTKGNWYFAKWGGLKFTPSTSIRDIGPWANQIPTQINASEGTMCMSDSLGKLLFYGGPCPSNINHTFINAPFRIFGKNYREIEGSPLLANATSGQGPIALPMADSSGKYMVFYTPYQGQYLKYSKIDITKVKVNGSKDTSFGKVMLTDSFKFDTLFPLRFMGEALTAIPKCNPKNFWIVLHVVYDSIFHLNGTGRLVVFDFTNNQLKYHSHINISQTYYENFLTVNPAGNILHFDRSLYRFDKVNGTLSLWKDLAYDSCDFTWGAMWSNNGSKLFRTEGIATGYRIFQYDVENTSPLMGRDLIAIPGSERVMQLGPDKKIYIATENQPYLAVVENPDSSNYNLTNKVGYMPVGVILKKGTSGGISNAYSLPNLINAEKEVINKNSISFVVLQTECKNVVTIPSIKCAVSWKWIWGDGNESNTEEGSHTYSSHGSYTIRLVVNGTDTVSRTILVGVSSSQKNIAGSDTVCTGLDNDYMVSFHTKFSYEWSAQNTSNSNAEVNRFSVKWNMGSGLVKLRITNNANGCMDSSSMAVYRPTPINNNIIDTNQITCDTFNLTNITGRTLSGGTGAYSYKWYCRNMDSTNWILISDATGQHKTVIKDGKSYHYLRVTKSGSCSYQSNIIGKILLSGVARIKSSDSGCFEIMEPLDSNTFGVILNFQWQQSTDSINFNNISGATSRRLLINKSENDKFYRLKISTPSCFMYSNILRHKMEFYFTQHPQNTVSCGSIPFVLQAKVTGKVGVNYLWQYQDANSNWVNLGGYNDDSLKQWVSWSTYRNFRLRATSVCGVKYSNVAQIGAYANPEVVSMDTSRSVSSGTSIKLKGQWIGERSVCYAVWQRSKNPLGGGWDSIGKTKEDSFLVTPVYTDCQQRWYYRIAMRTLCPTNSSVGTKFWKNSVVSKSVVEVGGYQNPVSYTDVWIPDSRNDNGSEPNWKDTQNFTHSHRLWNRNWLTKFQPVWDWWDIEDLQTDRDTNFIHVMVYNRGNLPVTNAKVFLYWTVMSVNEDWPYSWVGTSKFKNLDSNNNNVGSNKFNGPNGKKVFPLGGQINKSALEIFTFLNQAPAIHGHPAYGGQLQPGDSVLITYPWTQSDTVPKPGWYYGVVGGQNRYASRIGLCLLARMLTCDTPNFGLTYPEKLHRANLNSTNDLGYRGNIGYNVSRNNNIVSTNFHLGYMQPPFSDTTQVWILGAAKKPEDGGGGIAERAMKFSLCPDDPTFFNHGEVVLTLPDELWSLISLENYPGNGFNVDVGAQQLVVYQPCAEIGPISVPDTFATLLGMSWRYKFGSSQTGPPIYTLFTLKEFNEQELIGLTQLGLQSLQNGGGGGGNEGGGEGVPNLQNHLSSTQVETVKTKGLNVTPNPFNHFIDILYIGSPQSHVRIEFMDESGKLVKVICDCQADENGKVSIREESIAISTGIYSVIAYENGKFSSEKVIKCE